MMNATIRTLAEAGVRFVIIGGHAMQYAGMPRTTVDWDLFIPPHDHDNFRRINEALDKDLDMEVLPLGSRGEHFIQSFQTRWAAIQFHLIVAGGRSFDEAEPLATKEKADRAKDQDDLVFLRTLKDERKLI